MSTAPTKTLDLPSLLDLFSVERDNADLVLASLVDASAGGDEPEVVASLRHALAEARDWAIHGRALLRVLQEQGATARTHIHNGEPVPHRHADDIDALHRRITDFSAETDVVTGNLNRLAEDGERALADIRARSAEQ